MTGNNSQNLPFKFLGVLTVLAVVGALGYFSGIGQEAFKALNNLTQPPKESSATRRRYFSCSLLSSFFIQEKKHGGKWEFTLAGI